MANERQKPGKAQPQKNPARGPQKEQQKGQKSQRGTARDVREEQ